MHNERVALQKIGKLSSQISEDLMSRILNGEFQEEGYLYSEGDFCEIYQVSRSTIRDAIRGLEERGVLERQHGKGVKIIDKTQEVVTSSIQTMIASKKVDLKQLLEVRRIIEVPAARLAAVNASNEELIEMEETVRKMEIDEITSSDYIHNDLKFHLLVGKASKNTILESIIEALAPFLEECIEQTLKEESRPEQTKHYHSEVFKQIQNRNPDDAEINMRKHLEATEKLVFSRLEQVNEVLQS